MRITWISELFDFFYFLRNPRFIIFKNKDCLCRDGFLLKGFSIRNLLQWACLLWFLNIFILGPVACSVANIVNAKHKMEFSIPLFSAIVWAPIVEEMLFRYWMVSSIHFILIMPFFVFILFIGPSFSSVVFLIILLATCFLMNNVLPLQRSSVIAGYSYFSIIFHVSNVIFASLHIYNFVFNSFNNWYLMPLLVLPQWCTGLVLGWVRLTKGIIPSIVLHSIFNAIPAVIMWLVFKDQSGGFTN